MNDRKSQVVYPVRFERDDYERLKSFAASRDLNAAQVIRRAVRKAIRARKDQPDAR
jgi:hypothetical protein